VTRGLAEHATIPLPAGALANWSRGRYLVGMTSTSSAHNLPAIDIHRLRAGMVGMGMIFDETYRPFFEGVRERPLYQPSFGVCQVELAAVASRTGRRAEAYRSAAGGRLGAWESFREPGSLERLLASGVDFVCVATPDDRHFAAAKAAIEAGKHVLIEKPSVLSLSELDDLERLARAHRVLAKVVYHKLLDPDHKKLRTLVADGGYDRRGADHAPAVFWCRQICRDERRALILAIRGHEPLGKFQG
jgi:hypothetical protein